jgi:hypothetical protein
MFTADGLEDTLSNQIIAEIGQGPAPLWQTQFVGRLVGDPEDPGTLLGGQARPGATPADFGDHVESLLAEGAQDHVDRVGMKREVGRDLDGIPAFGVEQEHLGSSALDNGQVFGFEVLEKATDLSHVRFASSQRARHGGTSEPDARGSAILTKDG